MIKNGHRTALSRHFPLPPASKQAECGRPGPQQRADNGQRIFHNDFLAVGTSQRPGTGALRDNSPALGGGPPFSAGQSGARHSVCAAMANRNAFVCHGGCPRRPAGRDCGKPGIQACLTSSHFLKFRAFARCCRVNSAFRTEPERHLQVAAGLFPDCCLFPSLNDADNF